MVVDRFDLLRELEENAREMFENTVTGSLYRSIHHLYRVSGSTASTLRLAIMNTTETDSKELAAIDAGNSTLHQVRVSSFLPCLVLRSSLVDNLP